MAKTIKYFIESIKFRNEELFYFGLVCFISSIVFIFLSKISTLQISGINIWFKPFKFAISIGLFSWAMAWFIFYLPDFNSKLYSWAVIILLGFEIMYIALQAGRGQTSHFNMSTPLYSFLYVLMALAATLVTLYSGYIGILFFRNSIPGLPEYYVWGIRIGILLFVIFSLEGFVMGSRLSHTIGGNDGGPGIPFLNWSLMHGDPRIAHFIGMHALQVLPQLSFYVLKNTKTTIVLGCIYGLLALLTLLQAINGKPFHKL